jgi:hypothetical protein
LAGSTFTTKAVEGANFYAAEGVATNARAGKGCTTGDESFQSLTQGFTQNFTDIDEEVAAQFALD